jgi:hypothetical protein
MAEISSGVCVMGQFVRALVKAQKLATWAHKVLLISTVFYTDVGLAVLLDDLEGPVLHVLFDFWVVNLATNETLGVEDSIFRICGKCILGGISDSECVC